MFIYLFLLVLFFIFIFIPRHYDKITFPFIVSFILLIGGLREKTVGADTGGSYYDSFIITELEQRTWNQVTPMEPGFNYLIGFFKTYIINNYYIFYGFLFFFTNYCMVLFLKIYSHRPIVATALVYMFFIYCISFNVMRQYFALGIILVFFVFYMKHISVVRLLIFIIGVIVTSFLIHATTLVFITLPVLVYLSRKKISKNFLILTLVVSFLLFFFKKNVFNVILKMSGLFDQRRQEYLYYAIVQFSSLTINRIKMLMILVFGIVITMLNQKKDFSFYAIFIYCIGTLAIYPVIPITHRIWDMFLFLGTPSLTNIGWGKSKLTNKTQLVTYRCFLFLYTLIYFLNNLYRNYGGILPYKNWLFHF
jgi:hypothetical protein